MGPPFAAALCCLVVAAAPALGQGLGAAAEREKKRREEIVRQRGPARGATSAPGGTLEGRHLHQTRFTTVHWTTSFLGVSVDGGSHPARSLGPPKPRRDRRVAAWRGARRLASSLA